MQNRPQRGKVIDAALDNVICIAADFSELTVAGLFASSINIESS